MKPDRSAPSAPVVSTWLARSAEFFAFVKRSYLPDEESWQFSLASPDVGPQHGEARFDDPKATAAFMLRRIQVQRFLVGQGVWDQESVQLSLGYLSDLGSFVSGLLTDESARDEQGQRLLRQFRSANKAMLSSVADCHAFLQGRI